MGRWRTIADSRWLIVGAKTFSPPRTVGAGPARDGQWAPSWAGPPSQPGRWSVLAAFPRWRVGTIIFLDGCLAPAQGQSFCGPFAILSRAWPAPTETSIVVGRSGPRPRCQGGHARPLQEPGPPGDCAVQCILKPRTNARQSGRLKGRKIFRPYARPGVVSARWSLQTPGWEFHGASVRPIILRTFRYIIAGMARPYRDINRRRIGVGRAG